ncbi:iron ABC transporter permease (plasmid) [Bartonella sp. HY329]|uniref:FecCD family ABC transporter permease n=1 Tax=unclassified Bartonella TaxID=2645622 RepID=UPI0021C64798|nr:MULTISPECIES: iron ABC transporter permease [unclassified Bartonella]UXM96454.1 iron ABC transporter permease [Bartonella sp. HY329]UXN10777.1 iron ABC transporter permease [Bartonella sp. HY328]
MAAFFNTDHKNRAFRHWKALGLISLLSLTIAFCFIALFIGSKDISMQQTMAAIFSPDRSNNDHLVILELRLPRSFIAVLAGCALGLSGMIMQALTRNPLADPGIIGINAGAGFAVLFAVSIFHINSILHYIWFGFIGAGCAGFCVLLLSKHKGRFNNPLHLILSGVGVTIGLSSASGLLLINSSPIILDKFRHWSAGSVEGRGYDALVILLICVSIGLVICWFLAKQFNIVMLGDDIAQSLGLNLKKIWLLAFLAIIILSGSATAAIGPISFIGLVAPHLARFLFGYDYRWLLPASALLAGLLLLIADIVGRIIIAPNEVAAGILALLIGGPFFVYAVIKFHKGLS